MSIALFRVLLKNRRDCDEFAPRIRWSIIERLVAECEALEERVATMPQEPEPFDVVEQVNRSEARGDVRVEFARRRTML